MSRLLIGLLFGLGLFCIWWSFWPREPKPPASATRRGRLDRLGDELVQAGYAAVGPRALLAMCALMFLLVFVVFFSFTAVPSIALCFAVMAAYAPLALVRSRARRRRALLRDLWPDAVDNITSGVRAGLALPDALAQLAIRGPMPLRPAFARFSEDYRVSGRFNDSLDNLKANLADPVGDRLVEALRMAREVGDMPGYVAALSQLGQSAALVGGNPHSPDNHACDERLALPPSSGLYQFRLASKQRVTLTVLGHPRIIRAWTVAPGLIQMNVSASPDGATSTICVS